MIDLPFMLSLIALGGIVGFTAGLLGVGGGGLMVPILTSLFLWQKMPLEQVVHLALGTSMASIVVTSFSSLRAHHKNQGVDWAAVQSMAPGILLGAFAATFLAAFANALFLASFFALFMFCTAIQMLVGATPNPSRQLPGQAQLFGVGSIIGGISALASIGGGSLSVPFLHWHNVPIKRAIGTSAALGFPIAVSGTLGYIINGWQHTGATPLSFGFIYLPAVIIISALSVFTAPLGVKFAYYLPVPIIKRVFALLLFLLSAKMLFSVVS